MGHRQTPDPTAPMGRANQKLTGGSLAAGKTSNVELDTVFQRYLPAERLLPCDTLPHLQHRFGNIVKRLENTEVLYFPLFTCKHWIAGFLRRNPNGEASLTIHDSAPSAYVHRDLEQFFAKWWPQLVIRHGKATRQERGSEDCGLHMASHFFAHHTRTPIRDGQTVAARLRVFLSESSRAWPDKGEFMRRMVAILGQRPHTHIVYKGGAPKRGTKPVAHAEVEEAQALRRSPAESLTIKDQLRWVLGEAQKSEQKAAARRLCYMLAASALINVGDGADLSMGISGLFNRASRKGFRANTQYDLGETLAAFGKDLELLEGDDRSYTLIPSQAPNREFVGWYVQASPQMTGLPETLDSHVFTLGVEYIGDMEPYRKGVGASGSGHYKLTEDCRKAVFAVYMPHRMDVYAKRIKRRMGIRVRVDKPPALMGPTSAPQAPPQQRNKRGTEQDDELDEGRVLVEALKEPVAAHLNAVGSPQEGMEASPRNWLIYAAKPPHIQESAWCAKTIATRRDHIRWLQDIKAMPADLLNRPLPQAILELVRRIAVCRSWKWTTYSKTLANIETACEYLPLYSLHARPRKGTEVAAQPSVRTGCGVPHEGPQLGGSSRCSGGS